MLLNGANEQAREDMSTRLPADNGDSTVTRGHGLNGAPPADRLSRLGVIAVIAGAIALGWAWIVPMARDMYGPMTGASAWMMRSSWDAPHLFLLWLMWAVMMAAMMLPSAVPLLLLYDGVLRRRHASGRTAVQVYAMGAGYVAVWAVFSIGATALQRVLSGMLILNPMMEMPGRTAVGATLLLAGAWQLTPWKAACLSQCRSPLAFVMQRWRDGAAGALRMGVEHGAWCVGCCWALMLLLFAGGVMNLTVIVGLTAIVLIEKLLPLGVALSRVVGVLMLAAGVWLMVR
jgi:predicted metal-binding membrane protein